MGSLQIKRDRVNVIKSAKTDYGCSRFAKCVHTNAQGHTHVPEQTHLYKHDVRDGIYASGCKITKHIDKDLTIIQPIIDVYDFVDYSRCSIEKYTLHSDEFGS